MANTLSKIERLGLAETVQKMLADGITTGKKIARILREEHDADLSDDAVYRYLAKIKDSIRPEAFKIINEHVKKVVPDDLNALEEIESTCLDWSRIAGKEHVERIAAAAIEIAGEIENFKSALLDSKDDAAAVKKIIKECLHYIQLDDRRQDQRLAAMGMAVKIIDLKLRQSGLLGSKGNGQIVIVDRSGDYYSQKQGGKDAYKPFVIEGGVKNDG